MADDLYQPADHTVDEVNAYLLDADDDERARVLALEDERDGGPRKTVNRDFTPAEVTGADGKPIAPGPDGVVTLPVGPDDPADAAEPPADPAGVPAPQNPDATPATVEPKRYDPGHGYAIGDRAPEARYATLASDGTTTLTGNGGADEPDPGSYAVIVVQAGDTVTGAIARQLGA